MASRYTWTPAPHEACVLTSRSETHTPASIHAPPLPSLTITQGQTQDPDRQVQIHPHDRAMVMAQMARKART